MNVPKCLLYAGLEVWDFFQVRPERILGRIARAHVFQVFSKAFLHVWIGQNVVRDHGQCVGAGDGSCNEEDHGFCL